MRKISSQTPLQQRISLGYPQDLLARTSTKSGICEDLDRIPTRSPSKNLIQQDCPTAPNCRRAQRAQTGPSGPTQRVRRAPPDGPDRRDGPNGPNGPNPAEDHGHVWRRKKVIWEDHDVVMFTLLTIYSDGFQARDFNLLWLSKNLSCRWPMSTWCHCIPGDISAPPYSMFPYVSFCNSVWDEAHELDWRGTPDQHRVPALMVLSGESSVDMESNSSSWDSVVRSRVFPLTWTGFWMANTFKQQSVSGACLWHQRLKRCGQMGHADCV